MEGLGFNTVCVSTASFGNPHKPMWFFILFLSLYRFLLFYAFALLDLWWTLLYQKTDCKLILGLFLSLCLSGKSILCWQRFSTSSLFLASFFCWSPLQQSWGCLWLYLNNMVHASFYLFATVWKF